MSDLSEFFPSTEVYDDPKLKYWLSKKGADNSGLVEFRRKREGLSFDGARLYVTIVKPDGDALGAPDSEEWDADMDRTLIENGFRARTPANEEERFGFLLQHMFDPIEVRFGDGFFNSVLIDLLRTSEWSRRAKVQEVLSEIQEYKPNPGATYADCRDRIKAVIAHCGHYLIDSLKYERPLAEEILEGALAYYLDERFSVTNRQILGMTQRRAS